MITKRLGVLGQTWIYKMEDMDFVLSLSTLNIIV